MHLINRKKIHKSQFKLEQEIKRHELMQINLEERVLHLKLQLQTTKDSLDSLTRKTKALYNTVINANYAGMTMMGKEADDPSDMLLCIQKEVENLIQKHNDKIDSVLNIALQLKTENESLKTQISMSLLQPANIDMSPKSIEEKTSGLNLQPKKTETNSSKMPTKTIKEESKSQEPRKPVVWFNPSSPFKNFGDGRTRVTIEEDDDTRQESDQADLSSVMPHVVNLASFIEQISPQMWDILIAIGKEGFSEVKDIENAQKTEVKNKASFTESIQQLLRMGIIEREKINTGWRWAYVYTLTDTGRRIFATKFKTTPVKNEKEKLIAEHATAMHGYCIKDVASLLEKTRLYKDISYQRESNQIQIPEMGLYIPDITATSLLTNRTEYFEVERGKGKQEHFNLKCEKMRQLTDTLYFIVPDKKTMDTVEEQISHYILESGSKLKGIRFMLTTISKLAEGAWERKCSI